MPAGIKTAAVLPFDNLTTEPTLTQQVNIAVRAAMQDRLGLRSAGEATADALVRGSIAATSRTSRWPTPGTGRATTSTVTQRALQITLNIEIYDQKAGKPLWQRNGLIVEANYPPGQESEGRATRARQAHHRHRRRSAIPMVTSVSRTAAGRARPAACFTLLIFSAALYYGVHIGEVYWRYYQFQEEMRSEARLAPSLTDGVIRRRLLLITIDELDLPAEAQKITIKRIARPPPDHHRERVHRGSAPAAVQSRLPPPSPRRGRPVDGPGGGGRRP